MRRGSVWQQPEEHVDLGGEEERAAALSREEPARSKTVGRQEARPALRVPDRKGTGLLQRLEQAVRVEPVLVGKRVGVQTTACEDAGDRAGGPDRRVRACCEGHARSHEGVPPALLPELSREPMSLMHTQGADDHARLLRVVIEAWTFDGEARAAARAGQPAPKLKKR